MTRNQIDYFKAREEQRSNLAKEAETRRANLAQEALTNRRDTESIRQRDAELAETIRANMVREAQGATSLEIGRQQFEETRRSNLAREFETNRSNVARETETKRSNLAKEYETKRSNMAREYETHRSNLAYESIGRTQASASVMQANAALQNVAVRRAELDALNTFREASLALDTSKAQEAARHNRANEAVSRRQNTISQQQANTARARAEEDARHNLVSERQYDTKLNIEAWTGGARAVRDITSSAATIINLLG